MKKTLLFQYQLLKEKYQKFVIRLNKAMADGGFQKMLSHQKNKLLQRIERVKSQLARLEKLLKYGTVALAATTALATTGAEAQMTAQGTEFLVNTFTTNIQANFGSKAVAMDANGNYVVVWGSNKQLTVSTGYEISGQRYNASGVAQGGEFLINTFTTYDQVMPSIAMDPTGNFVVTWQSKNQVSTISEYDIYAQCYNASGVKQGIEFIVNTYTTKSQRNPSVAIDASGSFVVAWESYKQVSASSKYDIYAQRYNASGVAQGSEFIVNTYTTQNQENPSVAIDPAGDFIVVWNSYNQTGLASGRDIYAQRYNASGIAQGNEFMVNTHITNYQLHSSVAMDATGNFVVVWSSFNQTGAASSYDIYAQRYTTSGIAQGSEFLVNTYTTNYQTNPSVAMDENGNFVVAWLSGDQVGTGSRSDIYAQRYNTSGVAQGSEFLVNTYTTSYQAPPSIAMSNNGDVLIVWNSSGQAAYGSANDVYAQRYKIAGITAISDALLQGSFGLYPNPSKGLLTISPSMELGNSKITILNATGKVVLENKQTLSQGNNATLDLSAFQAGIYLLQINSDLGTETKKLVVE